MASAYLLINSQKNNKEDLMKSLKQIKELIEIHETFGEYNFVAKIESYDAEKLRDIVVWKIRILNSVKSVTVLKEITKKHVFN